MSDLDSLTPLQTRSLGHLLGVTEPVHAQLAKRHDHVWRLTFGREVVFLKAYTKDWYGDDPAATAFCLAHEADAWVILAVHGLSVPEVVFAARDGNNALGRPFLATRALPGRPLTELLAEHVSTLGGVAVLLYAIGAYLRRMHEVTFPAPGYVIEGGPTTPAADAWHHRCWTARARRLDAETMLRAEGADLPAPLRERLAARFATMESVLVRVAKPRRVAERCATRRGARLSRRSLQDWA